MLLADVHYLQTVTLLTEMMNSVFHLQLCLKITYSFETSSVNIKWVKSTAYINKFNDTCIHINTIYFEY